MCFRVYGFGLESKISRIFESLPSWCKEVELKGWYKNETSPHEACGDRAL